MSVDFMTLTNAVGTIGPRDDQQDRLDEFTERVGSGEFHISIGGTIPSGCIDGRCGATLTPNSAGGTNSLAAAEDLTNSTEKGYLESYRHVTTALKHANLPSGGHDDSHADDSKSGCGACDKLGAIYQFISTNAAVLRDLTRSLGINVDDETHDVIVANATARHDFPSGADIKSELETTGGTIDHLIGEHNEVVAVINFRNGTTLDRDALEAEFGPNYEAFNVDAWSFENAAQAISEDESSIASKVTAMTYYNLATAHVLCGTNLRVVVLR